MRKLKGFDGECQEDGLWEWSEKFSRDGCKGEWRGQNEKGKKEWIDKGEEIEQRSVWHYLLCIDRNV